MSHLWQWMKKLKWAGYGHKKKDALHPNAGELANFCPACPQPGANLENEWKANARNFIYRRSFVANGNFKADHVMQKGTDLWRQYYCMPVPMPVHSQCAMSRKCHAKIPSKQLLEP